MCARNCARSAAERSRSAPQGPPAPVGDPLLTWPPCTQSKNTGRCQRASLRLRPWLCAHSRPVSPGLGVVEVSVSRGPPCRPTPSVRRAPKPGHARCSTCWPRLIRRALGRVTPVRVRSMALVTVGAAAPLGPLTPRCSPDHRVGRQAGERLAMPGAPTMASASATSVQVALRNRLRRRTPHAARTPPERGKLLSELRPLVGDNRCPISLAASHGGLTMPFTMAFLAMGLDQPTDGTSPWCMARWLHDV